MVSLNSSYVEVNKDDGGDSDDNSPQVDEEEGGVEDGVPSPSERSSASFGTKTVVCSFFAGFLLGALVMFMGGSIIGSSPNMFGNGAGAENADDFDPVEESYRYSGEENEGLSIVKYPHEHEPIEEEAEQHVAEEEEVEPPLKTIINTFTVVEQVDHDPSSFTQGLSYGKDGTWLYETTGLYQKSKVRRINPTTFEVDISVDIDKQYFGEGSTIYTDANGNERLIAITWRRQTGFIYDSETLEKLDEFTYTTTAPGHQGWGITYDESNQEFIVSDGSDTLYFWDRDTLAEKRKVTVSRFDGNRQDQLNELEFMDHLICCNIWHSDDIICVDPATGESVREYDMSSLWPTNERGNGEDVLNGIALGKDHVLLTGKRWDRMYKVIFPNWPSLFESNVKVEGALALDNADDCDCKLDSVDCLETFEMRVEDSGAEDTNAVSYNFLRTTKGSQTFRLLVNDLLQLKPAQQQSATTSKGHASLSGPRRALTHLSELMDSDSQINSSCHPLAHNLGRAAYQFFGGLDEAYDGMVGTGDAHLLRLCNAAYLHGVIEFHLRDVEDLNNLASAALEIEENVCKKLINVNMGPWECHHGIGHGIVQRYRMESEKNVIRGGIATCKKMSAAIDCENGLWMDHFAVSGNIIAMETRMMAVDVVVAEMKEALSSLSETGQYSIDVSAIESRFQLPPRPPTLQICNLSSADYDCFVYTPTEYLLVHPYDYIGALQYCTDPSANISQNGVAICVEGAGSNCAKENMNDFSIVEKACETLDDENLRDNCFQAALGYFSMSTGGKKPSDAGLCDNLTRYKDICTVFSP